MKPTSLHWVVPNSWLTYADECDAIGATVSASVNREVAQQVIQHNCGEIAAEVDDAA